MVWSELDRTRHLSSCQLTHAISDVDSDAVCGCWPLSGVHRLLNGSRLGSGAAGVTGLDSADRSTSGGVQLTPRLFGVTEAEAERTRQATERNTVTCNRTPCWKQLSLAGT